MIDRGALCADKCHENNCIDHDLQFGPHRRVREASVHAVVHAHGMFDHH
jgi:hypothetical protein